jgi:long-chain acyl-CoA synthetase
MAATLGESLRDAASRYPDRIAFTFEGRKTDFATFERHAQQVAGALQASGIQAGERIAYIGKNSDLFFEALYGAALAGVVIAPINWRLAGPEISVIVADTQARLILVVPDV